jgi:hypothetical protein
LVTIFGALGVGCGAESYYRDGDDAGAIAVLTGTAGATTAGFGGAGGAGSTGSSTGTAGTLGNSDAGTLTGLAGSPGAAGAGAAGLDGGVGIADASGAGGSSGAAGATGTAGAKGTAGSSGAAGATGAAGAKGTAGASGAAGATGAAGAGAAGGGGSGGGGGMPAVTGACAGKVHVVAAGSPLIGNFEDGSLTGWYDYNDGTTGAIIDHVSIVSPGANGTAKAAHVGGSGLAGFGVGMGVELPCWSGAAFQGVTFWAKGTSGTDNNIQFQVPIPATHAVADGGDCVSKCFDHPSKHVALTSTWTQYHVLFSDLTQAGFGNPATYGGIIMALNWVSLAGPTVDFQVDEVAFY